MSHYKTCTDVTFTIQDKGVLASNHRARTYVWLNLPLFNLLAGEPTDGLLQIANLTKFMDSNDHFADPTGLDRSPETHPTETFETLEAATDFLRRHYILADDIAYETFLDKKQSILDRKRLGTFHQQLGYQLFMERRLGPETLWDDQKLDSQTG